jgi:hypothetical protein
MGLHGLLEGELYIFYRFLTQKVDKILYPKKTVRVRDSACAGEKARGYAGVKASGL